MVETVVRSAEDLRQAGIALFGPAKGWQKKLAEALAVDEATVSRWLTGNVTIPGPVRAAVSCWLRERKLA
jgi:hypothetical protein